MPVGKLKGDRLLQFPEYSVNRQAVKVIAPKLASIFLKAVSWKIFW